MPVNLVCDLPLLCEPGGAFPQGFPWGVAAQVKNRDVNGDGIVSRENPPTGNRLGLPLRGCPQQLTCSCLSGVFSKKKYFSGTLELTASFRCCNDTASPGLVGLLCHKTRQRSRNRCRQLILSQEEIYNARYDHQRTCRLYYSSFEDLRSIPFVVRQK